MHYVYLLELSDGSFYTGYTKNLKKRIKKHNNGDITSTKHKRPVEIIWYCAFRRKDDAIKFEKYLKTASGSATRNKYFI